MKAVEDDLQCIDCYYCSFDRFVISVIVSIISCRDIRMYVCMLEAVKREKKRELVRESSRGAAALQCFLTGHHRHTCMHAADGGAQETFIHSTSTDDV